MKQFKRVMAILLSLTMLAIPVKAESTSTLQTGDMFHLGSYPQSRVTDAGLIESLSEYELNWMSYNYYKGTGTYGSMTQQDYMFYADVSFSGDKYRAVRFTESRPYYTWMSGSSNQSSNGYNINTIYWFKYEPIQWRLLDAERGLAVCINIIDAQPYNNTVYRKNNLCYSDPGCTVYANNYEHSSLRAWLKNVFYETAFSAIEKNIIEQTQDELFLLTKNDVCNTQYGFTSNADRSTSPTDYTLCQGIGADLYCWLNTPGTKATDDVIGVMAGGAIDGWGGDVYATGGVRPAFYLNVDAYYNTSFINSQSSEYSYLMGESWKNMGIEYVNEYLLTFPSVSKAVIDSYNTNQVFLDSVAAWKAINLVFEPGELVDEALSMKDYYSAILLSLIDDEIMSENYIKSIEESSKFEYAKIFGKISEIVKSCDELDHEKLLSDGTCSIEEITILNDKINSLDEISSKISSVGNFLSAGKTINDSINLCINYYNVCNTSKYIVNVLKRIQSNSSNRFLSMAVDDIVSASEDAFDYVTSGFLAGTINVTKDYGVDKINEAWQTLLKSNVGTKGALLGYKLGKPLSNILFSTDPTISNYFEFSALYEVEKALKATIKDFETDFYNKADADSSLNYINAVSLYFKTYYLSCDYAIELARYSKLCPYAYIFYNGKQSFEEANKVFNATRADIKSFEDQLFRLWTYSLKERYPEIYSQIEPSLGNIYSTDLSTALVRLEYLSKTYTGEEMQPSVTVAMGDALLSPEEYTVTYFDNVEPGIAMVKITAVEGSIYTGEKTIEFTIKELPFVKRLSIRGSASQISLFNLCAVSAEDQEVIGVDLPDVYFYEGDEMVASVENGVITNDDLPIFITENGIDVLMQDKNYTVDISSDSTQIYNAEIQKLNEVLSPTEKNNYNNLLLVNGIQCNIYTDSADEIIVNNEVLLPDFSTESTTDQQQYNIYSDQCVVDSLAYENQRVYISAIIPEGNIFVGWSASPQLALSSSSAVSSFIMPSEDVYISVGFVVNQAYFELKAAINEAAKIGPGKYTKASYDNLQETIDESKFVLTNDISQELSEEKIAKLETAINLLEEKYPFAFSDVSLVVQDNIALNYKLNKLLFEDAGYTNPYVMVELNGETTTLTEYTVGGDYYVFSFGGITEAQLGQPVQATLYATYEGVQYTSAVEEYLLPEHVDIAVIGPSGTEFFADLGSAIQAYSSDSSYIMLNEGVEEDVTVSKNICLNLNGYDITGVVTVAEGCTLYCMDTQTDDYTVADGNYGKLGDVQGSVAAYSVDGAVYMSVTEADGTSFHRVGMDIYSMTLRASQAGVYYNSTFKADEVAAQRVAQFGVALSVVAEPTAENLKKNCQRSVFTDFAAAQERYTGTLLRWVMKSENLVSENRANAEMPVYGRAYILTTDGQYLFGQTVSRSFRQQVEGVDALWDTLTDVQKEEVRGLYMENLFIMKNWDVPNIREAFGTDNGDVSFDDLLQ